MRIARSVATLVAATVLVGAGLSTPAASAASGPEPWEPWEQEEFTIPAGQNCDFAIRLEVISQDIERRTISQYPDGTIHREQYRGPLTNYWINEDTGKRFFQDASGELFAEYYPNGGAKKFITIGPVGVGFDEDDNYPRGRYTLDGFHIISIDENGVKSMQVDLGEEEDVCAALS
jgi:hypothetical protein